MKFIARLLLVILLSLNLSPLAIADEYLLCDGGQGGEQGQEFFSLEDAAFYSSYNEEEIGRLRSAWNGEDQGICGEIVNPHTGFLEPGDCTAEGKVITEVSEAIGGETQVGENLIRNVYKGTCCFSVYPENEPDPDNPGQTRVVQKCYDTRSIYTKKFAECQAASFTSCEKRQWIIGTSGTGIVKVYVRQIFGFAAGLVGFLVVVNIVVNGIRISVSGVSGDISAAKDKIVQAIVALVLLFLSGVILYTVNPDFFG